MYKICKTPRSEARQIEFQETLINMLKKQKMKDITIVSLCKEMGISRKTFYQYFDTIEDVLYAIVDKELRNGFLLLEIRPQIDEFFEFWKRNCWLLDLLEWNGMSQLLVDRVYSSSFLNMNNVERFSTEYMKQAGQVSSIMTILVLWHHGGMQQSPQEMRQLLYDLFHVHLEK